MTTCPRCGSIYTEKTNKCECGYSFRRRERGYPALRFIAGLHRIGAYLALVIGVGVTLYTFSRDLTAALLIAVATFVAFVFQLAVAESIVVFIDIAEDTRRGVTLLESVDQKFS